MIGRSRSAARGRANEPVSRNLAHSINTAISLRFLVSAFFGFRDYFLRQPSPLTSGRAPQGALQPF